jgi:hypothetical protein
MKDSCAGKNRQVTWLRKQANEISVQSSCMSARIRFICYLMEVFEWYLDEEGEMSLYCVYVQAVR